MLRVDNISRGEHNHLVIWGGADPDHLACLGRLVMNNAEWAFFRAILVAGCPAGESGPLWQRDRMPGETLSLFASTDLPSNLLLGVPAGPSKDDQHVSRGM